MDYLAECYFNNITRGTTVEAHIADIHFGAMNPKVQYEILCEQFINKICNLNLDIICIEGDLFDHKVMNNSDVVMYANCFIHDLIELCERKNATLILIYGTNSHDANQYKSLYHFMNRSKADIRIIDKVQFEIAKGKKILCIPEMYNMGREYYEEYLYSNGGYDSVYMHGTLKNSIFGKNELDLDSVREPVFDMNCFSFCRGPIISGHIHVAQCLNNDFYYCGSPYRWCFGEEQPKGFYVLLHNLDTRQYYMHFEEIKSFRYDTVELDDIIISDPKKVVDYISSLKANGIDYIRLKLNKHHDNNMIIMNYYKNDKSIKIDTSYRNSIILEDNQKVLNKYHDLEFLTDPNIDEYEKFCRYVNYKEDCEFITVEELKNILNG